MEPDFDVLIIGSGFGGSVTALRLTEKGYRVGVLEAGRRFTDEEFAKTSWNLRKFLWAPKLGMYGIQRIHLLRNVMILAGAGVGGGSLNYANTLYVPPEPFFSDRQWSHVTGFEQRPDGLWRVDTVRTGRWLRRKKKTYTATHVVLAAGTWGTQKLLFKMRDRGKLPELSDRLGVLTRTNSESFVGAGRLKVSPDLDLTHGVAITSSIHPSSDT